MTKGAPVSSEADSKALKAIEKTVFYGEVYDCRPCLHLYVPSIWIVSWASFTYMHYS